MSEKNSGNETFIKPLDVTYYQSFFPFDDPAKIQWTYQKGAKMPNRQINLGDENLGMPIIILYIQGKVKNPLNYCSFTPFHLYNGWQVDDDDYNIISRVEKMKRHKQLLDPIPPSIAAYHLLVDTYIPFSMRDFKIGSNDYEIFEKYKNNLQRIYIEAELAGQTYRALPFEDAFAKGRLEWSEFFPAANGPLAYKDPTEKSTYPLFRPGLHAYLPQDDSSILPGIGFKVGFEGWNTWDEARNGLGFASAQDKTPEEIMAESTRNPLPPQPISTPSSSLGGSLHPDYSVDPLLIDPRIPLGTRIRLAKEAKRKRVRYY